MAVLATVALTLLLLVLVQVGVLRRARPGPVPPRRGRRGSARAGRGVGRVVLARWLPACVGGFALLVAADWGVGWALDHARGAPEGPSAGAALATRSLPPARDRRVDHPALADAAWADRYFAELEALDFTYVPFIGPREADVRGRYVSSAGGIRGSYTPAGLSTGAPEVWFFGGSTLWGEGQRDGHTIPSEVARLAEEAGTPVRAVNFGIRGYTAFQEVLLFEQELARRGPPDLAVFYHGFNELSTQTAAPENLGPQPTIFQLTITAEAFGRAPALPGASPAPEPSVRDEYLQSSAAHKLWRGLRSLGVVAPAGAEGADDAPFYVPDAADMARAVEQSDQVYRRSMALLAHVADGHDADTAVFWQPTTPWPPYDELTDRVASVDGGVDLTRALDDPPQPVYIDGIHTNELGARLVAEAMWPTLRARLDPGGGT